MGLDLRRCAEAAVHAALAEAFTRPEPRRSRRGRRRRLRPIRALLRLVRLLLAAVGLITTVRVLLDRELRREILDALASRFPIEELLEEIAVEVDAVRQALADDSGGEPADLAAEDDEAAAEQGKQPRRRAVKRSRGDTNGQRNRKPPSRGTRAA